ncbi:hypothetical protein ACA910_004599 [Epithemia clementina (nom. ined.)]
MDWDSIIEDGESSIMMEDGTAMDVEPEEVATDSLSEPTTAATTTMMTTMIQEPEVANDQKQYNSPCSPHDGMHEYAWMDPSGGWIDTTKDDPTWSRRWTTTPRAATPPPPSSITTTPFSTSTTAAVVLFNQHRPPLTNLMQAMAHVLLQEASLSKSFLAQVVCRMAALNLILHHDSDHNTVRIILQPIHNNDDSDNNRDNHNNNNTTTPISIPTQRDTVAMIQEFLEQLTRFQNQQAFWSAKHWEVRVAIPTPAANNNNKNNRQGIIAKSLPKFMHNNAIHVMDNNDMDNKDQRVEPTVEISTTSSQVHVQAFDETWAKLNKRDWKQMCGKDSYESGNHGSNTCCLLAPPDHKRRRIVLDANDTTTTTAKELATPPLPSPTTNKEQLLLPKNNNLPPHNLLEESGSRQEENGANPTSSSHHGILKRRHDRIQFDTDDIFGATTAKEHPHPYHHQHLPQQENPYSPWCTSSLSDSSCRTNYCYNNSTGGNGAGNVLENVFSKRRRIDYTCNSSSTPFSAEEHERHHHHMIAAVGAVAKTA